MASFSVRVVDDKHKPIQRAHIVLSFTGTPRGMTVEGYTDSDGYADFVGYDEGEAEVFVSGSSSCAVSQKPGQDRGRKCCGSS